MTTPVWQAGFLYQPGDLVQPITRPTPTVYTLQNPDFESGDVGWDKGGLWAINNNPGYTGAWVAQFGGSGTGELVNDLHAPVTPGKSVTGSCYAKPSTGSDAARVRLYWYDAADALISYTDGTLVQGSGEWRLSTVTGSAPAGAAFVALGASTSKGSTTALSVDRFLWNYVSASVDTTLIYKAVQPDAGFSDSVEPAWPPTLGLQVIDNEVIWEAVNTSRVVWEASPILLSGTVEPTWPTVPGEFVPDGTVSWETISRYVEQAPRSKVVVIAAKKVFAADRDVVKFSATVNPLDWTSADDAGYLPTGLTQGNANEMAVLSTYRGNLVAMNPNGFQMWQVDPDPALMALLDEMPGVGSSHQHAAQPVANDMLYLSQRGVRSVGIANAAENLESGDVGEPVDVLVMAEVNSPPTVEGVLPIATYYPGSGQYWLAFRNCEAPTITGNLPNGFQGEEVSYQYVVTPAYPGQTYTISLASGALPAGLSMDATGLITGTRTDAGIYEWTVEVTAYCGVAAITDVSQTSAVDGSYFITSTLYPVEVEEGLSSTSDLRQFREITPAMDAVQPQSDLLEFSLRVLLKTYTIPAESIAIESDLTEFALREILKTYTVPPESIITDSDIVFFELREALIEYTNWPAESIQSNSDILSFSLVTP